MGLDEISIYSMDALQKSGYGSWLMKSNTFNTVVGGEFFQWLWFSPRWIPVDEMLCLVRWRSSKSEMRKEARISKMALVEYSGYVESSVSSPASLLEAVKAVVVFFFW
ncbi:Uncharacterized protein Rs2_40300 [Raphanus sativus]|nr:Uncharacterized protein Rs2_40300 [Raphanus sativus]